MTVRPTYESDEESGDHAEDDEEICYRDSKEHLYGNDLESEKLVSGDEDSDDIDIDTLLQRPNASCHQQFTDFSNVFKAFIGSSLIGMPFAIHNAGIALGVIGIGLIALATDHCCNLIVKCKRIAIKRICSRMAAEGYVQYHIDKREKHLGRSLSFGQIGKVAMGKLGTFLVDTSILITQLGFCTGYFIFLGNTTRSVIYEYLHYSSVGYTNMSDSFPLNFSSVSTMEMGNWTTASTFVTTQMRVTTEMSTTQLQTTSTTAFPTNLTNIQHILNFTMNSTLANIYSSVSNLTSPFSEHPTLMSSSKQFTNQSTTLLPLNLTSAINETTHGILHKIISNIANKLTKIKNPITHTTLQQNKALTFALLLVVPAPLLVLIAFIRNLRKLGPVSVLANGAITGAFIATGIYILIEFESPHETIKWFNWLKFPVFFGQVTGAFEGIGTVIPIEGSMAENRGRYPCYLHISLFLLSSILGSFGVLGYLRYGAETNQIVTENLNGSVIVIALRCLLFFGVLFTYPLQIYPVIQIVEGLIFGPNSSCGRKLYRQGPAVNGGFDGSTSDELEGMEHDIVTAVKIPTWQSNILRTLLVLSTAAIAVIFRSQFAYIAALTGSIGSSLLSYILPCLFHIILQRRTLSRWIIAKDLAFIVFGIVGGIMGMTVTILEIVRTFGTHHKLKHG